MPNPQAAAVLVFRGQASGAEPPIRIIQGPKTGLVYPHSVNVDRQNNEIVVGDPGGRSIMIFPREANGDVPPSRVIQGSKTKIGYMVGVAIDPVHNLIFVGSGSYQQVGILIFKRTDSGDVAPLGIIAGPMTGIEGVPWQIQTYPEKGSVFVAVANIDYDRLYRLDKPVDGLPLNPELPSPWRSSDKGFIGVWKATDTGNVAPKAVIKGPISGLVYPAGLALNTRDGELIVSDSVRNGILTYLVPDFFRDMK